MLSQSPPQRLVPAFLPLLKHQAPVDYSSSLAPAYSFGSHFDSPVSPVDIQYQPPQNHVYSSSSHQYSSATGAPEQPSYDINRSHPATNTDPGPMNSFLDESPSPVDPRRSLSALPQSITVSHSQERFLHSDTHPYPAEDPAPSHHPDSATNRPSRQHTPDKYPSSNNNLQPSLLDQRRMSEPGPALFATHQALPMSARYQQQQFNFAYGSPSLQPSRSSAPLYGSSLHRGASTPSLRDLRHNHFEYPPQHHQQEWKHDESRQRDHPHLGYYDHRSDALDEPASPLQNTFAHGLLGSPTSGLQYSPISDNLYGPSPPGTGTSTSSSVAPLSAGLPTSPSHSISQHLQRSLSASQISSEGIDHKTYAFVSLPGNTVKKRPRRRYDEIERLYVCSWPECNKSYGTLNHLNAHVTMQKHGSKRNPNEFKELRKQWRKAKKEQEVSAAAMRRDSYSDSYDDHQSYGHRYMSQNHVSSHRHISSSVAIGSGERYSVPIDDIRFPPQARDDGLGYETSSMLTARQRYAHNGPASWQEGSHMSARVNAVHQQQSFGDMNSSSSLPSYSSQHVHHSQLPQLEIGASRLQPHPSTVPESQPALMHQNLDGTPQNGRLPQNSTLLTPLPVYPPPALMNSMQAGSGGMTFSVSAEGYDLYETDIDNGSRPGTGHASLGGHASTDEYSH